MKTAFCESVENCFSLFHAERPLNKRKVRLFQRKNTPFWRIKTKGETIDKKSPPSASPDEARKCVRRWIRSPCLRNNAHKETPAFLKKVPAFLKEVLAFLKEIPAFLKEITDFLKEIKIFLKDICRATSVTLSTHRCGTIVARSWNDRLTAVARRFSPREKNISLRAMITRPRNFRRSSIIFRMRIEFFRTRIEFFRTRIVRNPKIFINFAPEKHTIINIVYEEST